MRNQNIEAMKGFSIAGVVILHSIFIHYGENTEISNLLRLVCVNGFFVLSGYVILGKVKGSWVVGKIIGRIPMLIIFTLLFWLFNNYVVGIDGEDVLNISVGRYYFYNIATGFVMSVLWYVWLITVGCLVIYGFEKYVRPIRKVPDAIKMLALLGIIFTPISSIGLNLLKWYGLFMFVGYFIRQYKFKMRTAYFLAGLFPLCIILFYNLITYSGEAINSGYADIGGVIKSGEWIYLGVYLALSVTGICFLYCLCYIINKIKIGKPFLAIGGATIGVLLFHKPFLELNLLHNIWLSAIITLVISYGAYQLLRRVKILDFLLFGGTDIPIKIMNKLGGWYGKTQATQGQRL